MNEAEWQACTQPWPMLESLRNKVSDRKLRLFAVACCRRILHLVVDSQSHPESRQQSRNALELAERVADGLVVSDEERQGVFNVTLGKGVGPGSPIEWEADLEATHAIGWSTVRDAFDAATKAGREAAAAAVYGAVADPIHLTETEEEVWTEPAFAFYQAEQASQCELLRDIFGNPLRTVKINRLWRKAKVIKLAQSIYDERAFDRMPILGDALEESGCQDADILAHCRQLGMHTRGCWLIDLLTGRS